MRSQLAAGERSRLGARLDLRASSGPARPAGKRTQPRWRGKRADMLLGLLGIAGFLGLWEIASEAGIVDRTYLPPFTAVLARMVHMFADGQIYPDLAYSLKNLGIGCALGVAVGLPLGIAMGWYRTLYRILDPLISALYVVPFVAITPMLILMFGIWSASKIAIVFIGVLFPVVINTAAGIKNADAQLVLMARSFQAGPRHLIWRVAVPGAVPSMITGVRLGVYRGLIGIFVAELIASTKGLGYIVQTAYQQFDMTTMLVPVLIVCILGVLFSSLLGMLERHFEAWRPKR